MTERFEIIDKIKVVDAFDPTKLLAIIVEPDFGKKLLKILNAEQTAATDLSKLQEELKLEKAKSALLEMKLSRIAAIMSAEDINAIEVGPAKSEKKRTLTFKEKRCIGYGSQGPHMFTPTAGNQNMCPKCREAMLRERGTRDGRKHMERMGLKTEYRGTIPPGAKLDSTAVRQPTIEEVLDMKDVEERAKWEAKWSEAERKQAQIIKNKREMERIKAIRNRGMFSIDDPIMGSHAPRS